MGYQALLFCPDEKLARVVSQVFSELDFSVDPVHEPFAAVKQLMAHRYDAIVVDCDNEQNASLLFRSARNSSSNQSSLAFALVEGQTGVAKAYRIGANLVLTKPINVEQAKGTLRVARGLLRKNSDTALANAGAISPALTAKNNSGALTNTSQPPVGSTAVAAPSSATHELPEFAVPPAVASSAANPTMAMRARVDDYSVVVPTPVTQNGTVFVAEPAEDQQATVSSSGINHDAVGKNADKNVFEGETKKSVAVPAPHQSGSAAAPAPAMEVTDQAAKENKALARPASPPRANSPLAGPVPILGSATTGTAPSFGGLNVEDSGGSSRNKKFLIAAMIILALAVLGYLSDGKLGKLSTSPPDSQPATTPQDSGQSAPAIKPMSSPPVEPSAGGPDVAGASAQNPAQQTAAAASADKPSAGLGNSPVIHITPNSEPETKRTGSTPIVVASHPSSGRTPQAEDSAPLPPSTFVAASANNSNLNSLMSSASYNLAKPSLATLKVSQGVSQGLLIKRVQPKYPAAALAVHAQGSVQIEATINKEGNVINPKVLKGDPLLARAALDAVRQWRYKPYYLDNDPVEIQTQITINFKAN
jgi:TonB family protein